MPLFCLAICKLSRLSREFVVLLPSSVLTLSVVLICSAFLFAQSTGGRILGRKDRPSGAATREGVESGSSALELDFDPPPSRYVRIVEADEFAVPTQRR